jgi:hypothetical protein
LLLQANSTSASAPRSPDAENSTSAHIPQSSPISPISTISHQGFPTALSCSVIYQAYSFFRPLSISCFSSLVGGFTKEDLRSLCSVHACFLGGFCFAKGIGLHKQHYYHLSFWRKDLMFD